MRHLRFMWACAGIALISSGAIAQEFSSVVVFGDSLSDSGNLASTQSLPPGTSFTTNPDPVWAELVAKEFGNDGTNSAARGSNFAWGQACANPSGVCSQTSQVPDLAQQISQHLDGGNADPNALYLIWAGGNDIDAIATASAAGTLPASEVAGEVRGTVTALMTQIGRLKQAGARFVVVLTVPDPGRTPLAVRQGGAVPGQLSALGQSFNQAVIGNFPQQLLPGTIFVDAAALAEEVFEDADTYGFTNIQGVACPFGSNPARPEGGGESLVCGPASDRYLVAPDTSETYFFADGFHPSGESHELIANAVLATISAPLQAAMAGAGGKAVSEAHRTFANTDLLGMLGKEAEAGSWHPYVGGSFTVDTSADFPRLGSASAGAQLITLGTNYAASPTMIFGAAASIGNYDYDVRGASFEHRVLNGSLQATARYGVITLVGDVSFGRTSVNIDRMIALGTATRVQTGSTSVSQTSAEFSVDVPLAGTVELNHGIFLGTTWLDQAVKGYNEVGNLSTALNFSAFNRESVIARIGYRLNARSADGMLQPYARVAYETEVDNSSAPAWASSKTLSTRFAVPPGASDDEWLLADIGVTAKVSENATAFAKFTGRFKGGLNDGRRITGGISFAF